MGFTLGAALFFSAICGMAQMAPSRNLEENLISQEALPTMENQAPEIAPAVASQAHFTVVDGYLVAHLPGENVTVIAQKPVPGPVGEDQGWATWTQRGQLLWRGQMEDSQGRMYNIRILPGYVAPWHHAAQGWSDAASDLGDYGQANTWNRLGKDSRSCFEWAWRDSFWKFGIKGSGEAWSTNFETAKRRTQRKTFGWPLAYPWAVISSTFETLLRVPLGTAGAVVGTATGAVLSPAGHLVWPIAKATYHAGVDGIFLPVAGWSWQTIAAPPASLLASAPSPSRADGLWMKVMDPPGKDPEPLKAAELHRDFPEAALDSLARYAQETATLDAADKEAWQREQEELAAVRARHQEAQKALHKARERRLQAWAEEPANQQALQTLVKEGGDAASIQASRAELVKRLLALGLSQTEANHAVDQLRYHPLVTHPPQPSRPKPVKDDKTDPVKGALETVDRVTHTKIVQ
jgi:hypothetical protein